MKMYETPHALNDYLDTRFECNCGREHYASLKFVSVRKNALEDLPVFAQKLDFKSLYLICDPITYDIAGKCCMEILAAAGVKASAVVLKHTGFDEATLGELLINMPDDCDLVVAVGTGAINDMTRYFSFRMHRPFFTVATAAPMDGFASALAVLNINNLKTSIDAQTPTAIIGDTEILKNAPYRMIAAGLGDLLGKATCLCDWKLSKVINGEHYCDRIVELVEQCVADVLQNAGKAKDRDPAVGQYHGRSGADRRCHEPLRKLPPRIRLRTPYVSLLGNDVRAGRQAPCPPRHPGGRRHCAGAESCRAVPVQWCGF